ncbi:DUF3397 domain-containing protein [Brevibacillus humidisoli]|uniref:DUF3397 domain-containing protein n=1 Tax=Brevibacillus humidisoli TaxID=2895522 RepID=UPI001E5B4D0E|nr:DUF3397 domain-containing protein [Brevibacillus humidisoli]UFJ41910.1 DUF3397 domain-containing protein [Brevibacillus humidisoli]
MTILANLWGLMIVLPFFGFILVYVVLRLWTKDRRKSLYWSLNVTNIFLIEAVVVFYAEIWPQAVSAWWWIVLLFLSLASLLGWLQLRLRGKLSLVKIGFSTWRLSFVILCFAYFLLFTTGIWKQMQVG